MSLSRHGEMWFGLLLGALLLASCGCGLKLPFAHPSLEPFRGYEQRPSRGPVIARFLGTSSLLFQDGETTILSDGFVTRPNAIAVGARPIGPDVARIDGTLRYLGIDKMSAIFVGHSHYDHAMDAPVFAKRTGAKLLGSASTAKIGRGLELPESQIDIVHHGDTRSYGKFELTFLESEHSRGDRLPGTVDAPLKPPARASEWKTGKVWSVLIRHGSRTLLVHGSANFKQDALAGRHADVVYLGIGGLGKEPDEFVEDYWNEVVRATGARRVILVHWDDFFRGLDKPLRPMAYAADSFHVNMRRILQCAASDGIEVLLPVAWQAADPFAGLSAETPVPAVRIPHPCRAPLRR